MGVLQILVPVLALPAIILVFLELHEEDLGRLRLSLLNSLLCALIFFLQNGESGAHPGDVLLFSLTSSPGFLYTAKDESLLVTASRLRAGVQHARRQRRLHMKMGVEEVV